MEKEVQERLERNASALPEPGKTLSYFRFCSPYLAYISYVRKISRPPGEKHNFIDKSPLFNSEMLPALANL